MKLCEKCDIVYDECCECPLCEANEEIERLYGEIVDLEGEVFDLEDKITELEKEIENQ